MSCNEPNPRYRRVAGVAVTAATAAALLLGCCGPQRIHIVRTDSIVETSAYSVVTLRPPAARSELIPPAPSDRVVWDPGRWNWDGQGYIWVGGHYVERPYRQSVWAPGHWTEQTGGWVWAEGHWRA